MADDLSAAPLIWDDEWPPPPDQKNDLEQQVRHSIAHELNGLGCPGDLILHHVFLGEEVTDPLVFVYGRTGEEAFYCSYDPTPVWESLGQGGADG